MIKENLKIEKEDTTLTKLCKFCGGISIVICFLIFAVVGLVFFFILGGPTFIYKCFHTIYIHHKQKDIP